MSTPTTTLATYRHSNRVRRVLASIAPLACPPEIESMELVDAVVDHVELSMRSLPDLVRTGLVAGLTSYELLSRGIPRNRGRSASQLDRERARRYFESWRTSRIGLQRELIKGVKGLLCIGYYEQQAVKEDIGYLPEQWIAKVKRRRLQVYAEDITRHEASVIQPDPLPLDRLFPKAPALEKKEAS
ncbi:MAG TPA: hypothetical protein VML75_25620 [Kofleriaceae bacterium]|nr:hypothetical protein [Kofleriaceae bacterium]